MLKEKLQHYIDHIEINTDNISLQGWIDHVNYKKGKFYLEINNKIKIQATRFLRIERKDVISALKENCNPLGFSATFNLPKLYIWSIRIYIQLDNSEIIKIYQKLSIFWLIKKIKAFVRKFISNQITLFTRLAEFGFMRLFLLLHAEIKTIIKIVLFNKNRFTHPNSILIISHDLTPTGAPVLAINLANHFGSKYNVILLSHRSGELLKANNLINTFFFISEFTRLRTRTSKLLCSFIISLLSYKFNLKFAIVNSIESRHALPFLADNFIPSILLLHEFSSYTRPLGGFPEAIFWSDTPVFSTSYTYEDFITDYPFAKNSPCEILNQGHCDLSLFKTSSVEKKLEEEGLDKIFEVSNKNIIRIVGAGFIHYRKGVDLFIDIAAMVLKDTKAEIHFYWIGDGDDSQTEANYSVYLMKQIAIYGIENKVTFVPSTSSFKYILKKCDLFFLSSRLDPLPNVAIDAIFLKIPVVCFDQTSGFAEFLKKSKKTRNYLLANYLDLVDLKNKLNALIKSKKLRDNLANEVFKIATENFNFFKYTSSLENLIERNSFLINESKKNFNILLELKALNKEFSLPLVRNYSEAVFFYIRSWRKNFYMRKPFPGFHPGIYAEQMNIAGKDNYKDPLVDYLSKNKPFGSWNYPVITFEKASSNNFAKKFALHIHVYYLDLFEEIIDRLLLNNHLPDLFVSVSQISSIDFVKLVLKKYKGVTKAIKVFPNIGRDLAPFLLEFFPIISKDYEFIGHVHTKKSTHTNSSSAEDWNNFILSNILGSDSRNMMDTILSAMTQDQSIGMVFPDDPNAQGWDQNFNIAKGLAMKMNIKNLPHSFIFPIGSMFWARVDALQPLLRLNLKLSDFPDEPLDYDGTILHAIERLLPFAIQKAGFRISTCYLEGTSR